MNIIYIGAHPDDLEILCGGTIARSVAAGHRVTMAVATNGNVGSPTLDKETIGLIRRKEAEAASKVLGACELIWINENDEFLFDDERTRLKFVDAVRQAEADIIVTHNNKDYHTDHCTCSKLASDARILSAVRLIETIHPSLKRTPELYYMDSVSGLDFVPQYHVDISQFIERKMEALACHQSQDVWVQSVFGHGIADLARTQAAFRGIQCGVAYAEAFVQPLYWPKEAVSPPFIF